MLISGRPNNMIFTALQEKINDSNIIHINGGFHKYHLVFGKSDMCN